MPLLDGVADKARKAANGVRNYFTPKTETQEHLDHDEHSVFPKLKDAHPTPSTPSTVPRTKSVQRFLVAFDAEEAEQDTPAEESASRTKERSRSTPSSHTNANPINTSRTRDKISRHKRATLSSDERRALGIPERTPKDAVLVDIPRSRDPEVKESPVDMSHNFTQIRRGFMPKNNLNDRTTSKSTRAEYMKNTIRGTQDHVVLQTKAPSKRTLQASDQNTPKKKKRRVGSSPQAGRSTFGVSTEHTNRSQDSPDHLMSPDHTYEEDVEMLDQHQFETTHRADHRDLSHTIYATQRSMRHNHELDNNLSQGPMRSQGLARYGQQAELTAENSRHLSHKNSMIASSPDPPNSSKYFEGNRSLNADREDFQILEIPASPDELQGGLTMSEHQRIGPGRNSRPKMISSHQPTQQNKSNRELSKKKAQQRKTSREMSAKCEEHSYKLDSIVLYTGLQCNSYKLVLYTSQKMFAIFIEDALLGDANDPVAVVPLSKVQMVDFSHDCTKMSFSLRGGCLSVARFAIDFTSEKDYTDFLQILQDLDVDIKGSTPDRMDKMYSRAARVNVNIKGPESSKIQPIAISEEVVRFERSPKQGLLDVRTRRPRLIENLDPARPDLVQTSPPLNLTDFGTDDHHQQTSKRQRLHSEIEETHMREGIRDTPRRARTHRVPTGIIDNDNEGALQEIQAKPPGYDVYEHISPWKRDLVYPATGKKRETVSFEDLKRLNDDEFLNDNLVGLFLRYLQEHAKREYIEKMHFFNSFFFEALTKDIKGRKTVNYDAVAVWTKNVNIFNREFVIVPVNENFHWFMMIICNTSALKPKTASDEPVIEEKDEEANIMNHYTQGEGESLASKMILSSDIISVNSEPETRSSFQDLTLADIDPVNPPVVAGPVIRRRGRKYPLDKPVIMTLDSLDQNRSSVANSLRNYIKILATDIRQPHQAFNLEDTEIRNMTAKGIPTQHNFSDCGLYLCMYMEQFVCDPNAFVRRILQGDSVTQGWPNHIESNQLRQRLARMLDELYKEQQSKTGYKAQIPAVGSILVNMKSSENFKKPREVEELNSEKVLAAKKRYEESKAQQSKPVDEVGSLPPQRLASSAGDLSRTDDFLTQLQSYASTAEKAGDDAITIEDDPEPVTLKHTDTTSTYFQSGAVDPDQETDAKDSGFVVPIDDPRVLAAQLKQRRLLATVESSQQQPQIRSQSVSTDFLHGDEQWGPNKEEVDKVQNHATEVKPLFQGTHIRFPDYDDDDNDEEDLRTKQIRDVGEVEENKEMLIE